MNSRDVVWVSLNKVPILAVVVFVAGSLCVSAQQLPPETPRRLKGMAEQYERDGHKKEAAEVYERLVEKEPSSRTVVAPHLVKLYIDTRQPRHALKWAREYMDATPDPQAYLAGVYAQIGGYNEARSILKKEIAAAGKQGMRPVTLRWQLADLLKKTGNIEEARKTLKQAAELSGDKPEGAVAKRRLEVFEKKHPAPAKEPGPSDGTP